MNTFAPSVVTPHTPQAIGAALGLRGLEENWFGIGKQWAFTKLDPGLAQGCTFYVAPGSTLDQVRARWHQKLAAYAN